MQIVVVRHIEREVPGVARGAAPSLFQSRQRAVGWDSEFAYVPEVKQELKTFLLPHE